MRKPLPQSRNASSRCWRSRSACNASQLLQLDVDEDEVTFQAAARDPSAARRDEAFGGVRISETRHHGGTLEDQVLAQPKCTLDKIVHVFNG